MTGATSGTGTAYHSRAPVFMPGLMWFSCNLISSYMCMFCRWLFLSFCSFSFGLSVVGSSSIYGFWLPLWHLQILLGSSCEFYVQFLDSLVISAYFCDYLLVDHCTHSRFCWFIILLHYNFYSFYIRFWNCFKRLPKESSETINRSRTDNAMVKRRDKRTNNNLQKITQKTKDRAARTPSKIRSELRCSGRVISSCSTCDTRSVTFVTNPVINHEWRTYWIVLTTNGTYTWTQILHSITVVFPVLLSKIRFFLYHSTIQDQIY